MIPVLNESCLEYYNRRLREGWKCVSLKGYKAVLRSPDGILRPLDLRHDVLTLRPNAAGDKTELAPHGATYNWDCVDEVTPDEDTTYVQTVDNDNPYSDLYNFPNHTTETGDINSVKLYMRVRTTSGVNNDRFYIKTGGTAYSYAPDTNWTTSYATQSHTWTLNPKTGVAFTWTDIDNFQAGFQSYYSSVGRCTQVYVEVDYVGVVTPTDTTQAATDLAETSITGNGNITATGGANATRRGFCYKVGTSGDPTTADSVAYDDGDFGTGAYTKGITGLTGGTGYRVRAYAVNSAGTGYGSTVQVYTKILKSLAGSVTPSGVVSSKLKFFQALSGAVTFAGTVTSIYRQLKSLSGALSPSGNIGLKIKLALGGILTSAGVLTWEVFGHYYKTLTGALAATGTLGIKVKKGFTGSLTPSGVLGKIIKLSLGGTLTPSGVLTSIKKIFKSLAGSITPTGGVGRKVRLALGGTLSSSGVLSAAERFFVRISGTLSVAGHLGIKVKKGLSGSLSPSGHFVIKIKRVLGGVLGLVGTLLSRKPRFVLIIVSLFTRSKTLSIYNRIQTVMLSSSPIWNRISNPSSTDSGAGSEISLLTISPESADNGVGSEESLLMVRKSTTDDGAGSEESVLDTGE